MSEETEKQMDSGKEIYKFQSGDDIIREVMAPTVRFRGSGPILLELWGSQADHRSLLAHRKMREDMPGVSNRTDPC